jgi:hypothetical protein
MKFNVQTVSCLSTGACGDQNLEENPEECSDPLYAADNPTICTDSDGNPVTITGLRINPPSGTTEVGKTYPFKAILTFSDGREKDVTALSTWSSANTGVATVATTGYATGIAEGAATISAVFRTYTEYAQLTVEAACLDGDVDFCLVIDRSGSMQEVGPDGKTRMESTIEAVKGFVENVEYSTDQVAVVSFSGTIDETGASIVYSQNTTLHTSLTNSKTDVEAAVNAINPDFSQCVVTNSAGKRILSCLTFIGGGLQVAYDELHSSRARASAKKCVVLLTDGGNNGCEIDPEDVATQMRNEGFVLCVIALAVDDIDKVVPCDSSSILSVKSYLASFTNCDLFFDAATVSALPDVLARIPRITCDNDGEPCYYQPPATIAFEWSSTISTAQTATVGVEYSHSFSDQTNDFGTWLGDGVVMWTVDGDLPPGVVHNRFTHTLEGTPTLAGSYDITISGDNGIDPSNPADKTLSYTILVS